MIGDNLFFFARDCRAGKEVFSFCTPFFLIAYGKTRKKQGKTPPAAPTAAKTPLLFLCKMEKMFGVLHENGESTLQSYKRK